MRTAIVINGNIRTWERCKESFIAACGRMNADIFVSVSNKQYEYADYIRSIQNFYEEKDLTQADIEKMFEGFNVKKLVIHDSDEILRITEEEKSKVKLQLNKERHGPKIFESTYVQSRKLYYIMKDLEQYEIENGFKYDRIMKTRTEIIYDVDNFTTSIDNLNVDEMLIDSGSVPINDLMYVCSREDAFKISNYMYEEFYDPQYTQENVEWPPHSMLKNVVIVNKMKTVSSKLIKWIEREKIQQVY